MESIIAAIMSNLGDFILGLAVVGVFWLTSRSCENDINDAYDDQYYTDYTIEL